MTSSKLLAFLFLLVGLQGVAQITSGHVVYERKSNLYKKFKDPRIRDFIPEAMKVKIDTFDLYFNDSLSFFGPRINDLKDPMAMATIKNTVYQNIKAAKRQTIKDVWGENYILNDSLRLRTWKIIPGTKKVCGYECQKAMWQINDSSAIYAIYTNDISTGVGPESFVGLPGLILGVATADVSVVYLAKQVLLERVDIAKLTPKPIKGRTSTTPDLMKTVQAELGNDPFSAIAMDELFGPW